MLLMNFLYCSAIWRCGLDLRGVFCVSYFVASLDNTASIACASRLIIGAIYTSQIASHLTATPYRRLALLIYLV